MTDYCTVTEVKTSLPDITFDDSTLDDFFTRVVTAASRDIDLFTGREPNAYVAASATRYFDGNGVSSIHYPFGKPTIRPQNMGESRVSGVEFRCDEMAAAPTVVAINLNGTRSDGDFVTLSSSADYFLEPYNAVLLSRPYTRIVLDTINGAYATWPAYPKSIKITAKFGYSEAVPADVKDVVIQLCGRKFARAKQHYQSSMSVVEGDNTITFTDKPDTDIKTKLTYLRKLAI